MNLWTSLWNDESGAILSAEAALLGTVGIVGTTVGLSALANSVNDELKEAAFAFRSLDQSFSFEGQKSEFAWTAGSRYTQPSVEESHQQLREQIRRQEEELERREERLKEEAPAAPQEKRKRRKEATTSVDAEWKIDGAEEADATAAKSAAVEPPVLPPLPQD